MPKASKCTCGDKKSQHEYVSGFYDVRGHYGTCKVVGCPCSKYQWDGSDA
jgi:hypothetical protein